MCSPSILIAKPKFHFLVHLPAYIRRFGPAVLFSTERYESFNHVFRLTNIYSNRQAPSRDTCQIFAMQDIVRHIATGGFWFDNTSGTWVCAGKGIRTYLEEKPAKAKLLGVYGQETENLRDLILTKDAPVRWTWTLCSTAVAVSQPLSGVKPEEYEQSIRQPVRKYSSKAVFRTATATRVSSGDIAHIGNCVVYKNKQSAKVSYYRVYTYRELTNYLREPLSEGLQKFWWSSKMPARLLVLPSKRWAFWQCLILFSVTQYYSTRGDI